jgi:hypothetical protein
MHLMCLWVSSFPTTSDERITCQDYMENSELNRNGSIV